ncbi:hypothetical protein EDB80DRAFT_679792 [Ilyonectria destructans]|nr:hypothetical protein EDB80DRAFT_679792 [Ilyonectria destructans]
MYVSLAALSVLAVSVYAGPCHVQSSTDVIDSAVSTPSESLSPTLIKTTPINTNSIIGTPGVSSPSESTPTTPVASNAETTTPSTTPGMTTRTVSNSGIETTSFTELVVTLISTPTATPTSTPLESTTTSEFPAGVIAILSFCLRVITQGKINTGHRISGGSTSVIQRIFNTTDTNYNLFDLNLITGANIQQHDSRCIGFSARQILQRNASPSPFLYVHL